MKHVIVINTVDPPEGKPLSVAFQCDLIQKIERLIQDEVGEDSFYTQDRFNAESAIEATHEMYNAPKWNRGETQQQLVDALTGDPCTWGRTLPEFLDWIADRREEQAEENNLIECAAKDIRKAAAKIRASLKAYKEAA